MFAGPQPRFPGLDAGLVPGSSAKGSGESDPQDSGPAIPSPGTGACSSDLSSFSVGHSANPRLLTVKARSKSFISC